jgi:hypothetical protein
MTQANRRSIITEAWTTLIDHPLADKDVHNIWFLPVSENVLGRCVGLLIPECALQNTYIVNGEPLAIVNRPKQNLSVPHWLRYACKLATEEDCPISFACDTHEQAEHAAAMAAKRLPNHRRVALERMYQAETRTLKGLS